MTMELAGDRPPRYGEKNGTLSFAIIRVIHRSRGTGPRATGTSRPGGLSYGEQLRPGGLSYPRKTYHPANLGNLGNPALNSANPDRWGTTAARSSPIVVPTHFRISILRVAEKAPA